MRRLEEEVAALLGVPAALWVPSGCMGNLIALSLRLRRGDTFLAPDGAHVLIAELGSPAWLAGGMPVALPHDAGPGRISAEAVTRAAGSPGPYYTLRCSLLCLENTHNSAGGTVLPLQEQKTIVAAAAAAGLRVHLDGARIWNAAIALGVPESALTAGADSVLVCLSKGLGAPVGSLVAGTADFVAEARRMRKMLGGGVRQGGVLAAAGLVALRRRERLAEDHQAAATLAAGLRELGWDVAEPQTNIVVATVADPGGTLDRLADAGVLAVPVAGRIRFVTHRDASADVGEALNRIAAAVRFS
jgi:threonine aldolase